MIEYIQSILAKKERSQRGASAVEYGLMVAAIAALVVTVVFLLGGVVQDTFDETCGQISGGATATSGATCST